MFVIREIQYRIFLNECLWMLYFNRIDISEGININKIIASILVFYKLNYSFKFWHSVCGRCRHLLMMSMNLSDIAILNIKDYRCIITLISKHKAINLMQNTDLTEKAELYKA